MAVASRGTSGEGHLVEALRQLLLDRSPASVVINRRVEVVSCSGPTHKYFLQPPGSTTSHLIAQARHGLRGRLRAAVHRAVREGRAVTLTGVRVRRDGDVHRVHVTVEPLKGTKEMEGLSLVRFEDAPDATLHGAEVPPVVRRHDGRVRQLADELKATRQKLQKTIGELKAASEEALSGNEELRCLNAELSIANGQLEGKVSELGHTNDDLENLLASTGVATIFLDRQFRLRRFTPSATAFFGLTSADIGRPINDLAPKFADPDLHAHIAAVLATPVPLKREVKTKNGRLYMRRVLQYRARDGRTAGVVITFSDVASEELQAARAYAESILDSLREGVLVLDRDLRVVSANQAFYKIFQLPQDGAQGKAMYELGGRQSEPAALRSVLEGIVRGKEELAEIELARVSPDLAPAVVRLSGRALSYDSGRAGLFLLTITDVTPHRVAQRALEESEARFRGIVDSVADGIVTIDGRGAITSFNRAAESMFGYAQQEMLGKKVNLLMAAPHRDEHDRYLRDHVATGQVHLIGIGREAMGRRKDGSEFPIDLAVSGYRDQRGSRFVGILKDVSERRAAEQRLRQREAELAHTQRQHALGELTAGLAHELAQPLAAITNELGGCVRFVRAGRLRPRTLLASLQRAAKGAEHAAGVLRHVRELVEKRPAELHLVDLREVVASAADLVRKTAEHHRVRLRFPRVAPRPLSVKGDRIQLEQVLVNLLQNAIEAVATVRPVRREVEVTCRQTTTGTVAVAVHDSGPGLTRSERSRLFEPFFTTKPHGLGMGLAISRRIIEDHQGRIEVPARRPGGGTTVQLSLPLARQRRAK